MFRLALLVGVGALLAIGCEARESAEPAQDAEPPPTTSTSGSTRSTRAPSEKRTPLALDVVAEGLESPVHVTAAPGDRRRLYVVEQEGRIRVVEDGAVRREPFLDVSEDVACCGEQGLLSVAFHPDFESNRRLYVDYTNADGDTRVVELRADAGGLRADPPTARVLLAVDQPYTNHNGGQLAFGPDGLLYVGMGDGGSGGDPEDVAQDLSRRLGKLLRLDVDEPGAEWEVAAYGLRNPWRFSFDRATGDLYLGDVGQGSWEEVDYLQRGSGLVNFGWDVFEGRSRYEDEEPNPAGELVMPVHVYPLNGETCSVIGGFVYRGKAIRSFAGRYVFGDYCAGTIWSLRVRDGTASDVRRERVRVPGLTSFGEDASGEIYLVASDGVVRRLSAAR